MEDQQKIDGGPAFPFQCQGQTTAPELYYGMSLRDHFAAKAMQAGFSGHIAHYGHDNCWSLSDIATHAYEMADAMLIARAK